MRKKKVITILGLVFIWLLVIACEISCGPNRGQQDEAFQLQLTRQALQQTQQALNEQNKQPDPPPADEDGPPPDPDAGAPQEDEDGTPCNRSKFVTETIPDYTIFQPGETFEKTWIVRNAGDCTWTTNYKFKFTQGDRMDGAASQNLPGKVEPGETVTMSLDLTAPDTPGTYTGRWEFFDEDGKNFGWYSVVIKVQGPAPAAFAVTSVSLYMPHTWIDMACPGALSIKADISASAAGTVTYRWEDSGGGSSSTKSVTFASAGNKIVDYTTGNFNASGDYSARIYIDEPNHQWFGPISFHVNCTP